MPTIKKSPRDKLLTEYDRGMVRSAFVSLFWSIVCHKKERHGFTLKTLADKIGINKSSPSRWFSGGRPNWSLNTISDIANALDVDLSIEARDRKTGMVFTPVGIKSDRTPTTENRHEIQYILQREVEIPEQWSVVNVANDVPDYNKDAPKPVMVNA